MFSFNKLFLFVISNYMYYCASTAADVQVLNEIMDKLIADNIKKGPRIAKVNDYKEKVGAGHFHTSGGVFGDMHRLARKGDARMTQTGQSYNIASAFSFSSSTLFFEHYNIKSLISSTSGRLNISMGETVLDASAIFDYAPQPCKITGPKVQVTTLGKLTVKATGRGPFNKWHSNLATKEAKHYKDKISHMIERLVTEGVSKELPTFECEKYRSALAAPGAPAPPPAPGAPAPPPAPGAPAPPPAPGAPAPAPAPGAPAPPPAPGAPAPPPAPGAPAPPPAPGAPAPPPAPGAPAPPPAP